jgi:hypothetical protein
MIGSLSVISAAAIGAADDTGGGSVGDFGRESGGCAVVDFARSWGPIGVRFGVGTGTATIGVGSSGGLRERITTKAMPAIQTRTNAQTTRRGYHLPGSSRTVPASNV